MPECPNAELLDAYLHESGTVEELAAIEAHLGSCGECRGWIQEARENENVLVSVRQALSSSLVRGDLCRNDATPITTPYAKIAHYRIIREIGRGGMGVVYEAEQECPRRIVALKVVNPGAVSANTLRRFEFEAQILGRLHHPGIAQIYEAGTADTGAGPQPFFAMELIKGRLASVYADEMHLSSRQRLALFAKVCHAVQHAHQKGVIHRDIKPGNILVDEAGQPKILDFGVARATDSDMQTTAGGTNIGQLVGTLPYMSPEQVGGDPATLDTRSDVYSLGVVLYELLLGRLPYDVAGKSVPEAVRIITSDEPAPPSSINRRLRGDIETMLCKALEKDVSRRYQSASALATDIERYLRDEPIAARPAGTAYQLRKFARRNRALVGGIAGAFTFLVMGVVGASWQAIRATRAESEARRQRDQAIAAREAAEQIQKYVENILASADPYLARGPNLSVKEVLDDAAARVETDLAGMPLAAAAVRGVIGRSYAHLGLYAEARPLLESALSVRRELLDAEHQDLLRSLLDLAALAKDQTDYLLAEKLYREALPILRSTPEETKALCSCLSGLAGVLVELRRHDEAEKTILEAVAIMRGKLGDSPSTELAAALNNLAWVLFSKGDFEQAEQRYREALEMRLRIHPGEHPDTALSLDNLAGAVKALGRLEEAEALHRQALTMRRSLFGDKHPEVANSLYYLGMTCYSRENLEEAIEFLSEALEIRREMLSPTHRDYVRSLQYLSQALIAANQPATAETLLRECLTIECEKTPWGVIDNLLGSSLTMQGKYDEAETFLLDGYETVRDYWGSEHVLTRNALVALIELYDAWGKPSKANNYRALLEKLDADAEKHDQSE